MNRLHTAVRKRLRFMASHKVKFTSQCGIGIPWVPEGFFPLLFAVKIERRSRDRDEREKKPSGHGSYEPHFHEYRF